MTPQGIDLTRCPSDALARAAGESQLSLPADDSVLTRDLTKQVFLVMQYHFTVAYPAAGEPGGSGRRRAVERGPVVGREASVAGSKRRSTGRFALSSGLLLFQISTAVTKELIDHEGHSATTLGTSPEQAELRYSPTRRSPTADGPADDD